MHYDRAIPPRDALDRQAARAEDAARDLATAGVGVIGYGCTSGTFFKGSQWEEKVRAALEAAAGCTVLTTAAACIDAFRLLSAGRLSVVTPYRPEVNDSLVSYLAEAGIQTLSIAATQAPGPPPTVTPAELVQAIRQAWRADADALFVSCTGLHALDLIAPLEAELRRPVVTSNQATFWALMRAVGIEDPIRGYGRLLEGEV
jgi:maleate isomerase